MRPTRLVPVLALVLVGCVGLAGAAPRQGTPLPMGTPSDATIGADDTAVFTFEAASAGLLAVTVHTSSDEDLYVEVSDEFGQQVGYADSDLGGHLGSEALGAPIRVPGSYRVVVHGRGGKVPFRIVGVWLEATTLELPPDPDRSPDTATPIAVGSPHSDSIAPDEGDASDWFSLTVETAGTVTVLVEAAEGDLALDMYRDGQFGEAAESSDRDLEGVTGNESITVRAQAGETLYFRVRPVFSGGSVEYTIRAGIM